MDTSIISIGKELTKVKTNEDLPPHIKFEQYKNLRNHPTLTQKDRRLLTLLWETGGRISDVLSLRWKNFSGLNSLEPSLNMYIHKRDKPLQIPLSQEIGTDIREWKKEVMPTEEDYLFPSWGKFGRETRQSVDKKLKVWAKLIGLPSLHAHMFRHGLVVYLFLEQGLHYKIVAARTGHSNPMMILNTYSVVTEDMQREALRKIPMR